MDNLLSIIIPSYNEEENIINTANTVLSALDNAKINCELIFISDGSTDATFELIRQLINQDDRIKGIEFSRNFGKEAAILAGLKKGKGDCYVVMDCDLQHPPQTIIEMYSQWMQGYEVVEGIKKSRGRESVIYMFFQNLFYKITSYLTGFDMKNTSDFKLIDKKVADTLIGMPEKKPFFRALTFWTGFKSCRVYYDVAPRSRGVSKWSHINLIKYAISNIISFSSLPLNIVTYIGIAGFLFDFILSIQTLIRWCNNDAIEGFTTVILVLLFLGSCILIGLGLIGQYIAAIYEEVKQRPLYIIRSDINTDNFQGVNDNERK